MPRIYKVETDEELTLVKGDSQAQSLNHVIKGKYKVSVASALDVLDYMNQGGVVEDATTAAGASEEAPEGGEQPPTGNNAS